jgi:hypothetical protein
MSSEKKKEPLKKISTKEAKQKKGGKGKGKCTLIDFKWVCPK